MTNSNENLHPPSMESVSPDVGPHSESQIPISSAFELSKAMDPVEPISYRRRKRRFRMNGWLVLAAALLVLGWYVYVFPMERWEHSLREWWNPKSKRWLVRYESPQREMVRTIQFLSTLWFFYFGASIGSFFNVVAWRWPNGKGIVFGGSKCPYCDHRLKFIHNTPILGWLWCRGRCAFCKLPISSRYLWMEILSGAIFACLLLRELISGGANLPNWSVYSHVGFEHVVFAPKWPLIIAYFEHSFMFAALVMLAAASMEKLSFPWPGWIVFVICIATPRALMPELEFVPWTHWINLSGRDSLPILSSVTTIFVGAVFSLALASATRFLLPSTITEVGVRHWKQSAILLGALLGWQSSILILPAAVIASWGTTAFARWTRANPNTTWIATVTGIALLHHLFWREISSGNLFRF